MTSNRFSLDFESDTMGGKKQHSSKGRNKAQLRKPDTIYTSLSRSHPLRTSRADICSSLRTFPLHSSSTATALLSACCTAGNSAISSSTCNCFPSRRDILISSTDSANNTLILGRCHIGPYSENNICTLKKKRKELSIHIFSAFNSLSRIFVFLKCLFFDTTELFLILLLCRCEEVFQNTSQVVKGGPLFGFFLPAPEHHVIQRFRAVVWPGHSVGALKVLDYLWVGHTCTATEKYHRFGMDWIRKEEEVNIQRD